MAESFKGLCDSIAADHPGQMVLVRVSQINPQDALLVRYEWRGGNGTKYGPVFQATLQEWDRARE